MRHFVIGNGKSLLDTPLELLEDEISWGMNRISKIYDKTEWRPTYYFMVDHNQQNEKGYWKDCIKAHWDTPKWLWEEFRDGFSKYHVSEQEEGVGEVPNTTWIPRCKRHHYYAAGNVKSMQEWHFPELCTGLGGMSTMLQLAVQGGATEIYLLGCDLYEFTGDYNDNFFDPGYSGDVRDRTEQDNAHMTQLHEVAKKCCPIPIFNSTVGGELEVYPRKNIYEVLSE